MVTSFLKIIILLLSMFILELRSVKKLLVQRCEPFLNYTSLNRFYFTENQTLILN